MTTYLTNDEYIALQSRIESGQASMTVPRGVARQFFTHVSNSSIKAITDTSMFWAKVLIWAIITLSIVLFLITLALVINYFGFWSAIAVPLIGIFWVVLAGLTYEEGNWIGMTIVLIAAFINIFFMVQMYALPIFLFVLSVWIYRASYLIAQKMLLGLINQSYSAFDMLAEHVKIHQAASTSDN
jgi:hypothetical protein